MFPFNSLSWIFFSNYVLKWPLDFSGFLTNELNKCFGICLFYISMVVTVAIIWEIFSNAFFSSKDRVVWKALHCTTNHEWFIYLLYKEPRLSFSWVSVIGKKVRNIMMKITNSCWTFFVRQKLVDTIHLCFTSMRGVNVSTIL